MTNLVTYLTTSLIACLAIAFDLATEHWRARK